MVSAADAGRVRLNDQAVRPVCRTALEELHFHWQSGLSVRPLSGIIISPLADRFGRRIVLTLSISGMALGSLIIGLTPRLRRSASQHRFFF